MPNVIFKVGNYTNQDAIKNLVNYITSSFYFEMYGSAGCFLVSDYDLATQIEYNFRAIQNAHNNTDGKLVQHMIIGFGDLPYISEQDVRTVGRMIASFYGWQGFQCFWGSHWGSDKSDSYRHIHIALNPINAITGKRFYGSFDERDSLKEFLMTYFPLLSWSYEFKRSYFNET